MISRLKLTTFISLAMFAVPLAVNANDNAWPIAMSDQVTSLTQESITIPVTANDIGSNLEIIDVNTTTVGLGVASISADKKSVIYQSAENYVGNDSFWYAFKDDQGRTNAAKVTVTVSETQTKPLEWPTAGTESPEIAYNEVTELDVLNNDQGVGLTITQVNTTSVKLGSVSISQDGRKLIYTPPKDYSGDDEFWYVFSDSWGRTNAGKVTPIVQAVVDNSPWPTATPDYADTISTRSVLIPVLKNDIGNGLSLTKVNTTTVGLGKASIVGDYIRYVPLADYSGQDSFWYDFEDSQGRANSAQIFVNVSQNTELSSIEFCGANYFTDGTLENTNTSDSPIDNSATELNTTAEVQPFSTPTGTFAVVGDRQYTLEIQDDEQLLIVEQNGLRSTILTLPVTETAHGIGVRDNTLYFSHTVQLTINDSQVTRSLLLMHDGNAVKELGTYYTKSEFELMASEESTLIRYTGYRSVDSDSSSASLRNRTFKQYLEIMPQDNKAIHIATHLQYSSAQTAQTITAEQLSLLSFDQYLVDSVRFVITGRGAGTYFQLDTSGLVLNNSSSARLDKAIISNNRLLLTTVAHTDDASWATINPTIPPKLFHVDSLNGQLTELASCE